jgi:hypothetical protein
MIIRASLVAGGSAPLSTVAAHVSCLQYAVNIFLHFENTSYRIYTLTSRADPALVVIRHFYTHGIAAINPRSKNPVIGKEFGHTLCYHVSGSGRAVVPLAGV